MAAGEGKRFHSSIPKVLHEVGGRPMLRSVLEALAPLTPTHSILVVGHRAEQVKAAAIDWAPEIRFALQAKQLGTADAVQTGLSVLPKTFGGDVLVLSGDTPALTTSTLRTLLNAHRKSDADVTLLTAIVDDPKGYGRVLRTKTAVTRIVEEADATNDERAVREVNAGIYVFTAGALRRILSRIGSDNRQGEQYLTDAIALLKAGAVTVADPLEVEGANDRVQAASLERRLRIRTNEAHMRAGVTIIDPEQTYIDPTVKIGRDAVIHPMTFLRGATTIGPRCQIGPSTRIIDSKIDVDANVCFSEVIGATVGPEATVGPFAYLRPGARLARKAKVGTFVEVKASTIGEGSKVPHLSYIGDAEIGKDVNVGAATVTVNYDGETKTKAKTVIGDGAKIGSDTMLIAPVKVGKRAVTGAGSIVTKDVPAETVVVGNPAKALRKRKGEPTS